MPSAVKSWSGNGGWASQKCFPEKVMFNWFEVWKTLIRGREMPAKEAQMPETQGPELTPNGNKARETRMQEDWGKRQMWELGTQRGTQASRTFVYNLDGHIVTKIYNLGQTLNWIKSQIFCFFPLPRNQTRTWVPSWCEGQPWIFIIPFAPKGN